MLVRVGTFRSRRGKVGVVAALVATKALLDVIVVGNNVEVLIDEVTLLVIAAGGELLLSDNVIGIDLAGVSKDGRHLLKRAARCLWEDEEGGHQDCEVENGKNDIRAKADRFKHYRRHHHHKEIKDPVGRRRDTVGLGPDRERSDLSGVQPGHSKPTPGERGVEEEVKDDRDDGGRGTSVLDRGNVHDGEDNHADALTGSTTKHERTTTHLLNEEDGGPGGNEVLGTVGSGEDTGVNVREAEVLLKSLANVVGDEVDTGDLLEHLRDETEDGTVQVALGAVGEEVGDPGGLGSDKRSLNLAELLADEGVVNGHVVEGGNNVSSVIDSAFEHEPAWGFGKVDGDESGEDEDHLEHDRHSPSSRARVEEEASKVDPVGHGDTASNHGTFYHDKHTSLVGRRAFTLPDRDGGRVHTIADPKNNTENEKLSQAVGSSASNSTNSHDDGTDPDIGPTT